ncbi:hypothetical protein SGLAM104S_01426 [Streptomyces glaucescens]
MRDETAERPARQPVRPLGLHRADPGEVVPGHLRHGGRQGPRAVEPAGLDAVDRDVGAEVAPGPRSTRRSRRRGAGRRRARRCRGRTAAAGHGRRAGPVPRPPRRPRAPGPDRPAWGRRRPRAPAGRRRILPDPADEPGGQEGVAAEFEEVVLGAHLFHPEDLGEQVAQRVFLGGVRGPRAGVVALVGGGEHGAVELAVGGQRQRVQHHERGGHHVVGQPARQVLAQVGRVRPGAVRGNHVPGQAPVAEPVLADHDGGLGDTGRGGQRGLDLAGFDAEPADLDLRVGTAQVDELSVAGPAGEVAGAVHPGPPPSPRGRRRTARRCGRARARSRGPGRLR